MFLSFLYLYISIKKSYGRDISKDVADYPIPTWVQIINVLENLIITDALFVSSFWLLPFGSLSFTNLLMMFIVQDIYFYTIHKLFHVFAYKLHKLHHSIYGPFYAWHATVIEHITINLMSVGVPWYLFPNPSWLFVIICMMEIYTSVNGHTYGSPHNIHHVYQNKRLGSIYLVDRVLGTYA